LCTQKVKRNLLPLFINCCWHRILERWIVFIVYTETKKKSIRFIYIYLCTQKVKRNLPGLFINCCWHRILERWIVFYSLLLTQNGEMDSILFIVKRKRNLPGLFIYLCTQKLKRNLLPLFINCCWHRILERWIVFYSL